MIWNGTCEMNQKDRHFFFFLFFHIFNVTVALCVCVGWATVELRNAVDMQNCPPASLMGSSVCFERKSGRQRSPRSHDIRRFLNSDIISCPHGMHCIHHKKHMMLLLRLWRFEEDYSELICFLSSNFFKQNKCTWNLNIN